MNKHGILSNEGLTYASTRHGNTSLVTTNLPGIASIDTVLDAAIESNVETVWLVPGCQYARLDATWAKSETWDIKASEDTIERKPVIKGIAAKNGSKTIVITSPEISSWEWDERDMENLNAETMWYAITYLQKALDVGKLHHNPGVQGRFILNRTCNQEWLVCPTVDYRELPRGIGRDLGYRRIPTPAERDKKFLVAVDKKSAYLGACTGAKLGTDNPYFLENPPIDFIRTHVKEPAMPGLYEIAVTGDLPELHPLRIDGSGNPQEWCTTPVLSWLFKNGVEVEVKSAWLWGEGHRVLEKWSTLLYNARQDLKDTAKYPHEGGRKLAGIGIKTIATAGVGILASPEAFNMARAFFRPDWRGTIPELTAVRLCEQVQGVYETYGVLPIGIKTDCVVYLLDTPDIREAFPGKFDKVAGMGAWEVEMCIPMTKGVWDLLVDMRYNFSTVLKNVKKLGGE